MFEVLVAADSRGGGLHYKIMQDLAAKILRTGNVMDIKVQMLTESGATLETLLPVVLENLKTRTYDLMIVMIGVNNLSTKHLNCTVTPVFNEIANLVDVMTSKFQHFKKQVMDVGQPMVFGQLVGIKFIRYNEAHGKPPEGQVLMLNPFPLEQMVVDDGIPLLNQTIVKLNDESSLVGPWWQGTIHHLKGAKRFNRYRMLWDGLHGESSTKTIWATLIANSILVNRRRMAEPNWKPLPT